MTLIAAALMGVFVSQVSAEVSLDGFLQGLYGGRLDESNPTATEQTASETRMQLRAEHFGDNGEFFGRLDFVFDGADTARYDWELREGYFKFRLGNNFDIKVGRQILTWGTGDLIFINDVQQLNWKIVQVKVIWYIKLNEILMELCQKIHTKLLQLMFLETVKQLVQQV